MRSLSPHVEDRFLLNQKRIADQNRAKKPVIQQVIHAGAPLAQTCVPVPDSCLVSLAAIETDVCNASDEHD